MASKKQNEEDQPDTSSKEDPGTSSSTPGRTPEDPENKMYPEKAKEETVEEAGLLKNIKKENEEDRKPEKWENMDKPQEEHSHHFQVSLNDGKDFYNITCREQRTVLEAIKSHLDDELSKMKPPCKDDNIIIQLGKSDKEYVIPTHFPCCLVDDGQSLIISTNEKIAEVLQQHYRILQQKDKYSVFYIDTIGGMNTKSKKIIRNNAVKDFKFLCVYGEKGMTVKKALERDGRFCDFGSFDLTDNDNKNSKFKYKSLVDEVDQKKLKICLPKQQGVKKERETLGVKTEEEKSQKHTAGVDNPQITSKTRKILDIASSSGKSVKKILDEEKNSADSKEIYDLLRQQFPDLKQWMESRFPGDSYQETLKLRKENFGKIQQSFSEVHRLEELLKMGKSVCKIIVTNVSQGTGFVLFDRFILTNAHLFDGRVSDKKLQDPISVYALFNYDKPEPVPDYFFFSAEKTFVDIDDDLDYAVLELKPEGQKSNLTTAENIKVPPGLLNRFGPLPKNGEACIIGHPAGEVKKIDPTCIIEPEKREQAVKDHYNTTLFTIQSIIQTAGPEGIEKIMTDTDKVTNNTFMYHGASGSPVFDGYCRVIGLHTAGFTYGFPGHEQSVIEYAQPVATIFQKFVRNLKKHVNNPMLKKVEDAAGKNKYLLDMLQVEPMEEV